MVNAPVELVVTAVCSNWIGANPLPLAPAAYNCTEAPITGRLPAMTWPEKVDPL